VLLAEEDPANMRAVVDKADKLMVMHSPQAHDMATVAAVPQQESDSEYKDAIATIKGSFKKFNKKKQKKNVNKKTDSQPSKQSTLCFYHASFGDKARNCRDPCSWSEN
jgi:ABC-type oligopeptide transport system ATPase subunit